jgi:hypothetical protein
MVLEAVVRLHNAALGKPEIVQSSDKGVELRVRSDIGVATASIKLLSSLLGYKARANDASKIVEIENPWGIEPELQQEPADQDTQSTHLLPDPERQLPPTRPGAKTTTLAAVRPSCLVCGADDACVQGAIVDDVQRWDCDVCGRKNVR